MIVRSPNETEFGTCSILLFIAVLISTLVPAPEVAADESTVESVYGEIRRQNYQAARDKLEDVSNRSKVLFLRGLISFETGDYDVANKQFKRVLDEADTKTPRYRDSLYYLDRLKLYRDSTAEPPTIRVRIKKGAQALSFDGADYVKLLNPETSQSLRPRNPWTVSNRDGRVFVRTRNNQTLSAPSIRVESTRIGRGITYGGNRYRGTLELEARNGSIDVINELPLNDYLYGVVKKELARGWPMASLKAQAVAARSFALHRIRRNIDEPFDLNATWISQVYGGKSAETRRIRRAVDQTEGEVLIHRGKVIPAYFHANSGGHIETPSSIWSGQPTPFITPKKDRWSLKSKHDRWTTSLTRREINEGLQKNGHPPLNRGRMSINVSEKLPSGRADQIQYASTSGSITISADEFRVAVGPNKLKSTWFETITESGDTARFEGRGWGHGVGMSQWGARAMADRGKSYLDILNFYYEPSQITGQYGPTYLTRSTN